MINVKERVLHSQRAVWEKRSWGEYTVLDSQILPNGEEMLIKRLDIASGQNISYQRHAKRGEWWIVVAGGGKIIIGNKIREVYPGDYFAIAQGEWHAVQANYEGLLISEVQRGVELSEGDIERMFTDWKDIETYVHQEIEYEEFLKEARM